MEVLRNGLGSSKYALVPLLVNMVTAGRLGVKSGEGFLLTQKRFKGICGIFIFLKDFLMEENENL